MLGADQSSLSAVAAAAGGALKARPLGVGGCGSFDSGAPSSLLRVCVAVLDRNLTRLGREAMRQAVRLARGGPADDVVEVPIDYFDRPPGAVRPGKYRGPGDAPSPP